MEELDRGPDKQCSAQVITKGNAACLSCVMWAVIMSDFYHIKLLSYQTVIISDCFHIRLLWAKHVTRATLSVV